MTLLTRLSHLDAKRLRSSTGLTQAAFATALKVARRTVEDWEGDRRAPPWYLNLAVKALILPASVDAVMSEIADIMVEASVDQPAGPGAGYSVDYDEAAIRAAIEKAIPAPVSRDQILAVVRQYAAPAWCSVDRLADALVALKGEGKA